MHMCLLVKMLGLFCFLLFQILRLGHPTLGDEPVDVVKTVRVDDDRHVFVCVSAAVVRYVRSRDGVLDCARGPVIFDVRQEFVEQEEFYSQ
jgi:hypothetical protein